MIARAVRILAGLAVLVTMACRPEFETIRGAELKVRWERSLRDTAVSWWYAGQDSEYHYFLEKRPLAERGFRVPRPEVNLADSVQMPLTHDSASWINLKVGDIQFVE